MRYVLIVLEPPLGLLYLAGKKHESVLVRELVACLQERRGIARPANPHDRRN